MTVTRRRAIILINGVLLLIVAIWTIPTVGLLISSVRNRDAIHASGWWSVLPHKAQITSEERPIPTGQASDQPITIDGVTKSFQEWKAGVTMPDGSLLTWEGSVRVGKLVVSREQWTADTNFTLDNYNQVLAGQQFALRNSDGTTTVTQGENLSNSFLNS